MNTTLKYRSAIPYTQPIHQGKTRDTFRAPFEENTLMIVATNRLSTHNVVHQSEVPFKGEVLTALTVFWLEDVLFPLGIKSHLVGYGKKIHGKSFREKGTWPADLSRRAILVKKLSMIPVEFIFRAYLSGSLYKSFYSKGIPNPYGVELAEGLKVMSSISPSIFTPTDKSETDEPLDYQDVVNRYPGAYSKAYSVFSIVRKHLNKLGIEMVDSKFELGIDSEGDVVLADEVATPDSSRFCSLSEISEGKEPSWLDKQIVRDEAEKIWGSGPKVPLIFQSEVIERLSNTYLELLKTVTGMDIESWRNRMDS